MAYGLTVYNDDGSIRFDSQTATGGVCLGIVSIPTTGATFTFPGIGTGRQGFIVNIAGGQNGTDNGGFAYDENLGYPRFTFFNLNWARNAVLFLK